MNSIVVLYVVFDASVLAGITIDVELPFNNPEQPKSPDLKTVTPFVSDCHDRHDTAI